MRRTDPFFNSRPAVLIALADRHRLPAIWEFREFAEVSGLMPCGTPLADLYRLVGVYVSRVLKGEPPADLPVVQAAKFEMGVNLRTAKALGLVVPPTLLARADEVTE
jgi:putative tryptophan/tyrosine transport system substrate-binding protein